MSALLILLVVGLLLMLHELGHVVAARIAGIPVARFAVGLGPRLWSVRRGGTEYVVGLLPLGGYVMPTLDSEESYFRIPPGRRIVFALGGPLMNALVGYFLFVAAALTSGQGSDSLLLDALARTASAATAMLSALPALFSAPEQLSGVVGIVADGARFSAGGMPSILSFAALLSLNLAVINTLPLPPLDGGRVVLCMLERVHARATRLHLPLSLAGWALLGGIFVYVTAMDIARISGPFG